MLSHAKAHAAEPFEILICFCNLLELPKNPALTKLAVAHAQIRSLSDDFEADERRSKGAVLITIILCVPVIITLAFAIASALQPQFIYRYCLIVVLVAAVSFLAWIFAKKGHTRITAIAYIGFLILMIFGFSWTGGGIRGHGVKLLPIVVLFGGLTLGKKGIWTFGIISILGGLGFVIADQFDLLPVKQALGNSALINWIYATTSILMLCYFENLSVALLRRALHKSKAELELRTQSEAALRARNAKLSEIAFLQSHEVRRPVSNVLGLIKLIRFENVNDPHNLEIIPKLEVAAKELDAIIHQIVQKTGEIKAMPGIETENETTPL